LLLFLPMTPLIFMGQEWAARSPFLYFTDHEPELGRCVSEGRRDEFKQFAAFSDPARRAAIPDPQAAATFERSRLRWDERIAQPHRRVLALYRNAIAFRRHDPVMVETDRSDLDATAIGDVIVVRRSGPSGERLLMANFSRDAVSMSQLAGLAGPTAMLLSSAEEPDFRSILPPFTAVVIG
jgi:maltooligosyltrehalose trehalohydrolase